MSKKNLIVGQSGGPSCAINATLSGVIRQAQSSDQVGRVLGSLHGIEGIINNDTVDVTHFADYEKLCATPSMALGSCRYRLPDDFSDAIYPLLASRLREMNIGWFLYIGGNDSMDTVKKLSHYFALLKEQSPEEDVPVVFGLPKTIDNDLFGCDHAPGYGSAARYLNVTIGELLQDTAVYKKPSVTIVEIMGRNAGWLTLAAGLPHLMGGQKPQIIAIPEVPFDEGAFLEKIKALHAQTNAVVAVVSEGIRGKDGEYVGMGSKNGAIDVFGHAYLSGVGKYLERLVQHKLGCKVRSIEVNLMQRCAAHLASAADITESFAVGEYGASRALAGESGFMACIQRGQDENGAYKPYYTTTCIADCANTERFVPEKWYNLESPAVRKEITDYLLPLIRGAAPVFTDEYGRLDYVDFKHPGK